MARGSINQSLSRFQLRVPPRERREPRTYEPDPAAVANLKRILAEKEKAKQGKKKARKTEPTGTKEVNTMPDYRKLFTEDVVASWWKQYTEEGKTLEWIGQNNGIKKTSGTTIKAHFVRHGYLEEGKRAAPPKKKARPTPEPQRTAQPPEAPTREVEQPVETPPAAEQQPAPATALAEVAGSQELTRQLSAVQRLMSTLEAQDISVSGEITLDIQVKIAI